MLRRLSLPLGLSCLALALSCQQPPDVSGELQEYGSLINDATALICNCPEDAGFSTPVECDEALGTVTEEDIDCLADAVEGHEEAAQEYLDCVNAEYLEYLGCLEANVSCEVGALDACAGAFTEAEEACPQLSDGVEQAFGACTA